MQRLASSDRLFGAGNFGRLIRYQSPAFNLSVIWTQNWSTCLNGHLFAICAISDVLHQWSTSSEQLGVRVTCSAALHFWAYPEKTFSFSVFQGHWQDNPSSARLAARQSRPWYIKHQIAHEHQSKQLVRERYLLLSSDIIHTQLRPWWIGSHLGLKEE